MKEYKIVNGTAFDKHTPDEVIRIINAYMHSGQRIRVFYGDTKTGKDWGEELDTMGYVGRSTGTYKIPLLVKNKTSYGGSGMLDNCIVRITVNKRNVYLHPKYRCDVRIEKSDKALPYDVYVNDGKVPDASFKTLEKAKKWAAFIHGDMNNWS